MFSVVIPLYNKSAYIVKAVESVIMQTYPEFELIIINDGSTDNSMKKINNFTDRRIKILTQPNSGVSSARNNGVSASKHEYIAFLDADDWWDPRFLEEMKRLIENYPEAGLYGSNYFYVKNGINHLEDKGLQKDFHSGYIDYIKTYSSKFCVPINCSFVVVTKNAFLQAGGFKPSLKFGEDFDLWIRLALKYKVVYCATPLSYSNQDVPVSNRALGHHKLYDPSNHFIFNMNYLEAQERTNPELKALLDGIRVRSLQPYYLAGKYSNVVHELLAEVDFSRQPVYYRLMYKSPLFIVKLFQSLRHQGSLVKHYLIKHVSKSLT